MGRRRPAAVGLASSDDPGRLAAPLPRAHSTDWSSGRIWKRWRRWSTYRRPWRHLCAMHGLTVVLNDQVCVPKLHRVRVGYASDAVTVRMLYGQSVEDWQRVSDALAHAFGAMSVRVRQLKPGWAAIDVHHADALASVVPLPNAPCCEGIRCRGAHRRRDRAWRPLAGPHPWPSRSRGRSDRRRQGVRGLVGGRRSRAQRSERASCTSGSSTRKAAWSSARAERSISGSSTTPARATVRLLRDAAAILTERADRLRGVTRSHTPTVEEPLVLLVIDEIATLTAYTIDRKVRAEIEQLLGLILSQGRAVGVNVIAAVQDPAKDVLPFRQLFPTRIALRLTEPSQVAMVSGDSARDRGALCDRIPTRSPVLATSPRRAVASSSGFERSTSRMTTSRGCARNFAPSSRALLWQETPLNKRAPHDVRSLRPWPRSYRRHREQRPAQLDTRSGGRRSRTPGSAPLRCASTHQCSRGVRPVQEPASKRLPFVLPALCR